MFRVLFLCTGNSARSILGEAILNDLGRGRFTALSAGSQPAGAVNPLALSVLREHGHPVDRLHSKSWQAFAGHDAPEVDLVITVCDRAARQACPVWPGHPLIVHWGIPDPVAATGTDAEKHAVFEDAYQTLRTRIEGLLELAMDMDDEAALRHKLDEIGQATG